MLAQLLRHSPQHSINKQYQHVANIGLRPYAQLNELSFTMVPVPFKYAVIYTNKYQIIWLAASDDESV